MKLNNTACKFQLQFSVIGWKTTLHFKYTSVSEDLTPVTLVLPSLSHLWVLFVLVKPALHSHYSDRLYGMDDVKFESWQEQEIFPFSKHINQLWGQASSWVCTGIFSWWSISQGVMLTIHIQFIAEVKNKWSLSLLPVCALMAWT